MGQYQNIGKIVDTADNSGATEYFIFGTNEAFSTLAKRECPAPADFTLTKILIEIDAAPGASKSWQFDIMQNGSSIGNGTISGAASTSVEITGSFAISQGDLVCMSYVGTGSPTAFTSLAITYVYTCADGQIFFGGGTQDTTTNRNYAPWSLYNNGSGTDIFMAGICPTTGTIKGMFVKTEVNVPTGATFTALARLASVGSASFANSTNITVTINAGSSTGNTGSNAEGRTAGSQWNLRFSATGTALNAVAKIGVLWTPAVDGDGAIMGNTNADQVPTNSTSYAFPATAYSTGYSSESSRDIMVYASTFSDWYARSGAAPGAGITNTLRFRINAANGNLTFTITDANTSGSDTSNSDTVVNYDLIAYQAVRASGAAAGSTRYGWGIKNVLAAAASATVTHTIDALLIKATSLSHTIDSLLSKAATASHTLDAYLSSVSQQSSDHTVDALINKANSITHTIDALLISSSENSHDLDALIVKASELEHTLDAIIVDSATDTHTIDALIQKIATVIHTIDAYIEQQGQSSDTHTLDALIKKANEIDHSLDALISEIGTAQHSIDAGLYTQEQAQHSADAYITTLEALTNSIDALIRKSVTQTHSIDARISTASGAVIATTTIYLPKRSAELLLGIHSTSLYQPKRSAILNQ